MFMICITGKIYTSFQVKSHKYLRIGKCKIYLNLQATLDQEKPTEKELDTVRVVQAIQKSKEKKEEREKEKTVCLFMDFHCRKKQDRLLYVFIPKTFDQNAALWICRYTM